MARWAHAANNNLDWKIRRVWLPEGIRPIGAREMHEGSTRPHQYAGLGVILSPLFTLVFALPTLAVMVPLRLAKLSGWRIEAVAKPWGRRGPATVLAWRVKGWSKSHAAIEEIAHALERGETNPQISMGRWDGA